MSSHISDLREVVSTDRTVREIYARFRWSAALLAHMIPGETSSVQLLAGGLPRARSRPDTWFIAHWLWCRPLDGQPCLREETSTAHSGCGESNRAASQ